MKAFSTIVAILASLTWLCSFGSGQSNQAGAPTGNSQNGKRIYISYGCYQCHGRQAQGSTTTGPRLGPRPILFSVFVQYVRQPTGQMPAYSVKIVSDPELADIYAFLGSLPQPTPTKSISLLN
jgi:mono/diheme cytochrome c family protein